MYTEKANEGIEGKARKARFICAHLCNLWIKPFFRRFDQ